MSNDDSDDSSSYDQEFSTLSDVNIFIYTYQNDDIWYLFLYDQTVQILSYDTLIDTVYDINSELPPFDELAYLCEYRVHPQKDDSNVIIIIKQQYTEHVLGFAFITITDIVMINVLCASNDYTRGIGTILLDIIRELTIYQNIQTMVLFPDEKAMTFYENYGFIYNEPYMEYDI